MGREVIIMGNRMVKRYKTNITDIEKEYRFFDWSDNRSSLERQESIDNQLKVIESEYFKEYVEVTRSTMISRNLKVYDSIYLEEENKCYTIKNVAENIYGDTIYFINKTVEVVWDENKDKQKEKAQKEIDEYLKRKKRIEEKFKIPEEDKEGKWWSIFK